MKIPHKITRLTPEQAYIYGFLEGKMFEKTTFDEFERDEFSSYEKSNGETLLIKDMNDYHLVNAYKKLRNNDEHTTMVGLNLLNEIKYRGQERYLETD